MMSSLAPLVSLIFLALSGAVTVAAFPTASDHTLAKRATIADSQTVATSLANLGASGSTTTINAGVTYWLAGYSPHNVYGNLDNSGNLIISQTAYTASTPGGMSSYFQRTGSSDYTLQNRAGATIQLNDVYAASAPSYYWWLNQMANAGLIVMEQVNSNLGTAASWAVGVRTVAGTTPSQVITNDGGFLMRQARVDLTHNVAGSGCWMIDDGATLFLQSGVGIYQSATAKFSPLSGQSISFVGAGVLHMDSGVYAYNSTFGPTVYGFDSGKAIEFSEVIKSYSYTSSTGVLRVVFTSGNSVSITLAGSYSSSSFSTGTQANKYGSYNALFSSTSPGTSAPAQCQLTTSKCSALSLTSPSTSTSSSSTSSTTSTSTTSSSTSSTTSTSTTSTTSSTSSTVTTTTRATSSSTSSTTSSSTSTAPVPASTFSYGGQDAGCYEDTGSTGTRSLNALSYTNAQMTNEMCANYCGKNNYPFAGTQYSTECFCGYSLPVTKSNACNMPCGGNSTETCGGSWLLNVTRNADIDVPDAGALGSSYNTTGCYAESTNGRIFSSYSFTSPTMTVGLCASTCSGKGYAYSGTEYATECYCSSWAPVTKSTACTMACGGNSAQICGGGNALSVVRDTNIATSGPTCGGLPSGYVVCAEGQTVKGGVCV
ncbi:WSC-domain-containing protein [Microstroma glucosiphilum]|uniref:WSC-domain-containing protein n=1 Tax=Pseudomicrostroma glucosiphilum TaxID=1684307 RepID=A0A316U3F2_9BASI|nr:WSC-domain-containing protein [Pseudomicrostroma glucosiphilum]PWN19324.1 WSC-domain-containing protein [Pseudomicrostroma glucosiphilum]